MGNATPNYRDDKARERQIWGSNHLQTGAVATGWKRGKRLAGTMLMIRMVRCNCVYSRYGTYIYIFNTFFIYSFKMGANYFLSMTYLKLIWTNCLLIDKKSASNKSQLVPFFWGLYWFNLLDLCELIQAYPNLFWHILADIFKSADGVFPDVGA